MRRGEERRGEVCRPCASQSGVCMCMHTWEASTPSAAARPTFARPVAIPSSRTACCSCSSVGWLPSGPRMAATTARDAVCSSVRCEPFAVDACASCTLAAAWFVALVAALRSARLAAPAGVVPSSSTNLSTWMACDRSRAVLQRCRQRGPSGRGTLRAGKRREGERGEGGRQGSGPRWLGWGGSGEGVRSRDRPFWSNLQTGARPPRVGDRKRRHHTAVGAARLDEMLAQLRGGRSAVGRRPQRRVALEGGEGISHRLLVPEVEVAHLRPPRTHRSGSVGQGGLQGREGERERERSRLGRGFERCGARKRRSHATRYRATDQIVRHWRRW